MSGITIGVSIDRCKDMERNAYKGRALAIKAGASVYAGRECKSCGVRMKRTSDSTCLYCTSRRSVKYKVDKVDKTSIRSRAHDADDIALMKSFEL